MYSWGMAKEIQPGDLPQDARIKYPWAQWTNGNWWQARRGEDFNGDVESFRSNLYAYTKRHGLKVTTKSEGDVVAFKITRPLSDGEAAALVIGLGAAALHHTKDGKKDTEQ